MSTCEVNFRHVNRDGLWPDFQWYGLELLADGTLRLPVLPRLAGKAATFAGAAPSGPSGVAVDWDGSIFFTDPATHRLFKIDGCSGEAQPARCVGGYGELPSQFDTPRGLWMPASRRALYVVDSGHHRVLILDPVTGSLEGVLGGDGGPHPPPPGDEPGRFAEPWTIAGDAAGNVYVVDRGNRRVQKFDAAGFVDPWFWDRAASEGLLDEPVDIAVADAGDSARIYVLDHSRQHIVAFDGHGRAIRLGDGQPWALTERLNDAMGLVASDIVIYVGDNAQGRVLQFDAEQRRLIGEAVGFTGAVGALAIDLKHGLLVHGGGADAPVTLRLTAGHGARGVAWGGPFSIDCPEFTWRHVRATATIPPADAHLEFFWHLSPLNSTPGVMPDSDDPFPASAGWRPAGKDLVDFFVGGDRTRYLWLAARFAGNGSATATLSQLRIQFDGDSYLKLLPSIYQDGGECGTFLDRYLALFESVFERTEDAIRAVPRVADPDAAAVDALPWLAGWLGLLLDEEWDEGTRRDAIKHAYARFATQGTAQGLRQAIQREAGVPVVVHEPIRESGWWILPSEHMSCDSAGGPQWSNTEGSVLGWTTALVSAEPQGAIVGTTATLDHTHLITDEEFAGPLFDEVAHQVQVLMYPAFAGDHRTVQRVRGIIERDKPAHVTYHLCIAKPELRVGIQARLGMDAIVSNRQTPSRLPDSNARGGAMVLAGSPPVPLGAEHRVGVSTRL